MLKQILLCITNILGVCFSSFPYLVYNQANESSNLAFAGVGLGLIRCQQLFWVSNVILGVVFFNFVKNYFINAFLCVICFYLYINIVLQINYLMKFFTSKT